MNFLRAKENKIETVQKGEDPKNGHPGENQTGPGVSAYTQAPFVIPFSLENKLGRQHQDARAEDKSQDNQEEGIDGIRKTADNNLEDKIKKSTDAQKNQGVLEASGGRHVTVKPPRVRYHLAPNRHKSLGTLLGKKLTVAHNPSCGCLNPAS